MSDASSPLAPAAIAVRVLGRRGVGRTSLVSALLEAAVGDEELVRWDFFEDADGEAGAGAPDEPGDDHARVSGARAGDLALLVVRGAPEVGAPAVIARASAGAATVLVAVHASDLLDDAGEAAREAWCALVEASRVHATATPGGRPSRGVDALRASIVQHALEAIDAPLARGRRAKRPYAVAIIAGAAVVTALEGIAPGAAALVLATQVGAISSLNFLYTGRWPARTHVLALVPVFVSEAAGGSAFLVAKSFLPPTGVLDGLAAAIAASLTIAMLGAVTVALELGYTLEEKRELRRVFQQLRARTKAERATLLRNRERWTSRAYWAEVVRSIVFPEQPAPKT